MNPVRLQVIYDRGIVDAGRVRVPVMGCGPLFGDSAYVRVPACGGRRCLPSRRLARVKRSLAKIGPPNPDSPLRRRQALLPAREPDVSSAPVETNAADGAELRPGSPAREPVPVTRRDDRKVGNAPPGPVWRRLNNAFQDDKRRVRETGDCGA